jgi:hypothetical protein
MSIAVICPSCAKEHKVKDDSAGKKLRCKSCQTVISIPAVAATVESDPWDTADDGAEAAPVMRAPPPRMRKSNPKPEKSSRPRRSSGTGMPAAVIVAICANSVMFALNLFGVIGVFVQFGQTSNGAVAAGQTCGVIFPLIIEVAVVVGLLRQNNRIRWNSIVLDGLGLAVGLLTLAGILFLGAQHPQIGGAAAVGTGAVVAVLAIKVVLWITDMVALLTPSAQEWCNK